MNRILKTDFKLLCKKRKMVFLYVLLIFSIMFYCKVYTNIDGEGLFEIFNTITILYFVISFIFLKGELLEKNIIRYYLEGEKKRYNIIIAFYIEHILIYLLCNTLFLGIIYTLGYKVNLNSVLKCFLIYIVIYFLYITIVMNLVLYFKQTGISVTISLILLWGIPNLINFICYGKWFYRIQIFYYLSPNSFFGSEHIIQDIGIAMIYSLILMILSVKRFQVLEF